MKYKTRIRKKKGVENLKKAKKIISIIVAIAVIIYVGFAVYMLIVDSSETYIVTQDTLSQEEESIGYIIRDEKVVKGENYKNGIYPIASEGQRVAVGESIFRYYSDSEKEVKDQINGLSYKLQELLEQEKNITSADIKSIEKQIEEKIQTINTLTNYQEIVEAKKNIDNLIIKKINFIGDATENKEIKRVIKDKKALEEQLKKGSQYQTTDMAGIVSYRVDGLEEKLKIDQMDQFTEEFLNELDLQTGKIITASNECGKVIDNFKCYIAVMLNSKEAMQAEIGDKVDLRISNAEEISAKVFKINEQSGKRTIIFEITQLIESFVNHRKVIVDVIWWNETGLKIPTQALVKENGKYYVIRNKAGIQSKLLVNLKCQTDKFVIVEPYDTEELKGFGFSYDDIRNYKKITNYDEIVVGGDEEV